ncbi:MAG: YbaN family protein [Candidatus Bathyarchaeota archaeon]|nr:YbaN family protein [Candidatus Bathyarchaeota archaeon]
MNKSVSTTSCKDTKRQQHRIVRLFLIVVGTICLIIGAIGMVVPLLPTTPFLLLATACYCRSSTRLYNWLLNNRWFGTYIKNYREGKGIPLKTKVVALIVLWIGIFYSMFFVVNMLVVQLVLLVIAVAVSLHILKVPTLKKK